MAAEAAMVKGEEIESFVQEHFAKGNKFDFMLRTKVDKSSKLVLVSDEVLMLSNRESADTIHLETVVS